MLVFGVEYTGDPSLPDELLTQYAAIVTAAGVLSHCNGDKWSVEYTAPNEYKVVHNLNRGSYSINIATTDPYAEATIVETSANHILVRTRDQNRDDVPQEFYFTLRGTNTAKAI